MSLLTSLISYWKLDEASGNALDANGSNDLTDNNSVGSTTGKISNARSFTPASSQYLSHADNADLSTGDVDFTIAAWVYAVSLPSHATMLSKREALEYILEYTTGSATFRFFYGQNALSVESSNFGTPSTGTWYHVVIWHDATANEIGISVNAGTPNTASDSGANAVDGNGSFNIGRDPIFGSYWDGRIDEVGFWKRVLTSQERTDLYNGGAGLAYSSFGGGAVAPSSDIPIVGWINNPVAFGF